METSDSQTEKLSFEESLSHARSVFPDNQNAANLLAKSIAGSLSPEEQKLLDQMFAEKEQKKRFSSEVIDLFDRHEKGDPNVVFVDMNSVGGDITVAPDAQARDIFTSGLGGCYASLLYFEQPDGVRNASLVHFDPAIPTEQLSTIVLLKRAENLGLNSESRAVVLIEAPGNWARNEEGKWVLRPSNQEKMNSLKESLLQALQNKCADLELKIEVYPIASETRDHGVLRVHIPLRSEGEVEYKTWFSSGALVRQKSEK